MFESFDCPLALSAPAIRRARLGVEALECRVVPAIVYSETFVWEHVTVEVTVDDAEPGFEGLYFWNYHLTNDSFVASFGESFGPAPPGGDGVAVFVVPVEGSGVVSNIDSSVGWAGAAGFLGDPSLIGWEAGAEPGLGTGNSADFWFTTIPTARAYTNGLIDGPAGAGLTDSPAGLLVVPVAGQAPAPLAPPPKILVATEVDKLTPNKGLTSLREAIRDVNLQAPPAVSQVRFTDGMDGKTITLGNMGSLPLERAVTISTTTFSGQVRNITVTLDPNAGAFSLFQVSQDVNATIEGLKLTGAGVLGPRTSWAARSDRPVTRPW